MSFLSLLQESKLDLRIETQISGHNLLQSHTDLVQQHLIVGHCDKVSFENRQTSSN